MTAVNRAVRLMVVMGVSGCGKSTVGSLLAQTLDAKFLDADDCHPQANIEKMKRGDPLDDADRLPWLTSFAQQLAGHDGRAVGACSALKRCYRERITAMAGEQVLFIHLDGSRALIGGRMSRRTGHFMPHSLLDSQFSTLEPPQPDEPAIVIAADADSQTITGLICERLGASNDILLSQGSAL